MSNPLQTPIDADKIVADFYDAFETAPSERLQRIAEVFSDDLYFSDPRGQVLGHKALDEMADEIYEMFPGCTFDPPTDIDSHANQIRFRWALRDASGEVVVRGQDILVIADDGRIKADYSFFEPRP